MVFSEDSPKYCTRQVHALGVARTLYAAPRGAVKHVVTVRRRSSSYATMFQTKAQQATPECQQSVLVKREVLRQIQSQEDIMFVMPCQERRSSVAIPSLLFVSLTCGAASCMWRVISNSTRPTGAPQPIHQRQIDGLPWMALDRGGSCGYTTLRRSIYLYKTSCLERCEHFDGA